ncbi:MAG: rpsH [Labilithrix sp.]|nr:rpsH [Labilithrix sp.]
MAVLTDPISDFLTRWKNASRAKKQDFIAPYSKLKAEIARVLQEEGYIWGFEVETTGAHPVLKVKAKYNGATPVLNDLKRMSSPGMRQYVGSGEIPKVLNGLGISILSTPKGVMTGAQARKQNVGGELLAIVW